MRKAWLEIPLADYEAHMALPHIGQARLLSDIFASVLQAHAPRSLAVLGCAGGNGFERISTSVTDRVVGVDLNPTYVAETRARFGERLCELELFVADIERDPLEFAPVDLVFAALLLEYVDVEAVLRRIGPMLRPHARLVTVVQLPGDQVPVVTPSPFPSLGALASVMRLIPPDDLQALAVKHNFNQTARQLAQVRGGKRFMVQTFQLIQGAACLENRNRGPR